jgi:hypothetical protein
MARSPRSGLSSGPVITTLVIYPSATVTVTVTGRPGSECSIKYSGAGVAAKPSALADAVPEGLPGIGSGLEVLSSPDEHALTPAKAISTIIPKIKTSFDDFNLYLLNNSGPVLTGTE